MSVSAITPDPLRNLSQSNERDEKSRIDSQGSGSSNTRIWIYNLKENTLMHPDRNFLDSLEFRDNFQIYERSLGRIADIVQNQLEAYRKSGDLKKWTPEQVLIFARNVASFNNDIGESQPVAAAASASAATPAAAADSPKIDLPAFFRGYFAAHEDEYRAKIGRPDISNMTEEQKKQVIRHHQEQLQDVLTAHTLLYQQHKQANVSHEITQETMRQTVKYIYDGVASSELKRAYLLFWPK